MPSCIFLNICKNVLYSLWAKSHGKPSPKIPPTPSSSPLPPGPMDPRPTRPPPPSLARHGPRHGPADYASPPPYLSLPLSPPTGLARQLHPPHPMAGSQARVAAPECICHLERVQHVMVPEHVCWRTHAIPQAKEVAGRGHLLAIMPNARPRWQDY